ncbi:Pleiotropic drug resistance protein 3 [Dendrobium catenatum]|uniref:Pleiotropic drug resistance protein 3 n=1 Tax=Dendrobium catenatum TaxID=906689 RepID=A0A2I0XAC8_9ASPA|nr:Pleiotropic drug resistance protein 3 [Dendrobium catenatum]
MTLLLGPPGSGKTTLLLALAGKAIPPLKITGNITYNGFKLEDFVPEKTSAYISQHDLHISQMTVRETLDFAARCQGVGDREGISIAGLQTSLQTDYILKILGLDICSETKVGDTMRRGISGGPTRALFMDEISNGLDSSTTFQIISCIQQLVHIMEATSLISLLQPAPETFNLFDDIILMSEGKIIYHGPRDRVLHFFQDCGFICPKRKGIADFLQEVISEKDQAQYWSNTSIPYRYVTADQFSEKFKFSRTGEKLEELLELSTKSQDTENDIAFAAIYLNKWELFKTCMAREFLLMKRDKFVYIAKIIQIMIVAIITMTVFLHMQVDLEHSSYYVSSFYYTITRIMANGIEELSLSIVRLPVFYKQRDLLFYPAWAYSIPISLLKIPLSLVESFIWTALTYYVIGYAPELQRFFCQFLLLFILHQTSTSIFRFLASITGTAHTSSLLGNLALVISFMFGGFILPKYSFPFWLRWAFWFSPATYAQIALSLNEFQAPRWQKLSSENMTLGQHILKSQGLDFKNYFYWLSIGALFGFTLLLNIGIALALTYSNSKFEMRDRGFGSKRLQLLQDITGAFRPGVLTALMGVSGAGKTTLMDVLCGRKTGGMIEGDIRIGGYPKIQETFARVSGYCEQNDIHSPQITIKESLMFSASLRLPPDVDPQTRAEFVDAVLETVELDGLRDALVGIPGINGLSTEQRKRLTIAVELVANPSILFMDEPTSGVDARSAAIVMRAVKNIAEMGRTVICTIHQPSIDIFESFDEVTYITIPKIPKIKDNYNPATWMLEVTSTTTEENLGIDFVQIYKESTLYQDMEEMVKNLSIPPTGSSDLHFNTRFPQNKWCQFKACFWKLSLSYWRSPAYNFVRLMFMTIVSVFFMVLFWQKGRDLHNERDIFSIMGSMYLATVFLGIMNSVTVLPIIAREREVLYRERFAGMYSCKAYAFAQVVVEIPCTFTLAAIYVISTYPTIGYYWSVYKIIWYFYTIFCALLYFNYMGMLIMSVSRSTQVASVLLAACCTMLNLFSGFLMPKPHIPKWWIWLYWICPTSWTLNGLLTSQYGDVTTEIIAFGETKTVTTFLTQHYGFHPNQSHLVAFVIACFPIIFASLFFYYVGKLNFQRR